jgi:hypothetical protein
VATDTIRRLPSSPRSRVWLVEFDGAPAIVKQITGGPDAKTLAMFPSCSLRSNMVTTSRRMTLSAWTMITGARGQSDHRKISRSS